MQDEFTPEQRRRIMEIAQTAVRHELANLGMGTADGEPRQTTQWNLRTLWAFAADYQTEGAAAIRKWVFDRYKEYDTPEAQKNRQHIEESRAKSERWRESVSKAAWGVVGAIAIAAAMAIYSHAGAIFGGK